MQTIKTERIEIDLPQDILFAMKVYERPEEVKNKMKTALALLLFQERVISLGKAAELADMNRVKFLEVLAEHGLPAYEYGEKDFNRDQRGIAKYRKAINE
jgi:predicted HTH domain antitoxin